MRVLLGWLRELVDIPDDPAQVVVRLTMAGLEVDAIERLDRGLEQVVVGEVRAREPLEGTKLSLCSVFDGTGELRVVCGAQNYGPGAHVPLARVGAVLPDGKKIERAKIRGVESNGMLCSGKELGIDNGVDGLLLLPADTIPGMAIAKVLGRDDATLEVNITPNRGDALSHLGIARDLGALYRVPVKEPAPRVSGGSGPSPAHIGIEAPDRCARFSARVLEGVRVGPSPLWLARRLEALGQRSVSNIVDATNYVLFELGQPLHAYDADKVAGGSLVARLARARETLRTLDGKDRALSPDDLVIADAQGPAGLAGVMGGEASEVKAHTTRLLLESAWFSPGTIRRTARRYALFSEASHRFERGVDPEGQRRALDRLTEIVLQVAGGRTAGEAVDVVARPYKRARIPLRRERLNALLGLDVPWDEATALLRSLGLEQLHSDTREAEFEIPGSRSDLAIEVDLVEEVARLRGFESIPARALGGAGVDAHEEPVSVAERQARSALMAAGFDQAINFAFASPADLKQIRPDIQPIMIRNPLAENQSAMRTTLLPGLLRNAAYNLRHGVQAVRLYEAARVYLPAGPSGAPGRADYRIDSEPLRLGLVATGPRGRSWASGRDPIDFYDLKGAIETVLDGLNIATDTIAFAPPGETAGFIHPRSAARLFVSGQASGLFGELHPEVAQAFDLPRSVFVAELGLDALLARARLAPPYRGVPRFPASLRDVALVVDEKITAAGVLAELRQADTGRLLEDATIFDVYRGAPLPAGKKNLAFALRFRSLERTLTDEEVNALHAAIVGRLEKAFGAALRT